MEILKALSAFSALSQKTRLETFKLLIRATPERVAAGDLARTLYVPQNTMSSHLTILVNAGLLNSIREGRSILYSADLNGTRALVSFLLEECCQGSPDECELVLNAFLPGCCSDC
jgi:DNA-binding transcriptional ArsR family regulator